jgi:formyltetrahydrofolate deformylase
MASDQSVAKFILSLSCQDRPGIVSAVSGLLHSNNGNIVEAAQYGDRDSGRFFMRVEFEFADAALADTSSRLSKLSEEFSQVGQAHDMQWRITQASSRMRALILVSKFGHCLNDLLYRHSIDALPIDIPAVVSNHRDWYRRASAHDIAYHHLPVTADTKLRQEEKLLEIVEQEQIDLLILARYMQVLSPALCQRMAGRIINIHHSFLPSFKGAKPYHQAHARGVKLIGATAHYVTSDLDEGPIIEQEVARVNHGLTPDQLAAIGRDTECVVLARAVKYHAEHRIFLNGNKTVVFPS